MVREFISKWQYSYYLVGDVRDYNISRSGFLTFPILFFCTKDLYFAGLKWMERASHGSPCRRRRSRPRSRPHSPRRRGDDQRIQRIRPPQGRRRIKQSWQLWRFGDLGIWEGWWGWSARYLMSFIFIIIHHILWYSLYIYTIIWNADVRRCLELLWVIFEGHICWFYCPWHERTDSNWCGNEIHWNPQENECKDESCTPQSLHVRVKIVDVCFCILGEMEGDFLGCKSIKCAEPSLESWRPDQPSFSTAQVEAWWNLPNDQPKYQFYRYAICLLVKTP